MAGEPQRKKREYTDLEGRVKIIIEFRENQSTVDYLTNLRGIFININLSLYLESSLQ